jgi:hypothetical protein
VVVVELVLVLVLVLMLVVPRVELELDLLMLCCGLTRGTGRHGLELSREKEQQVGLLRVMSEFVPREWVPGPVVDLESLGCSVAVMVAPRSWTWVPLYTIKRNSRAVERSMKMTGALFNS